MSAVLQVEDLSVQFRVRRGSFGRRVPLRAVDGISFEISSGETLGLVGESGSGKSTTARALLGLIDAEGEVLINGRPFLHTTRVERRQLRRQIQMVFQDPYSSLDPSMTVADSIAEPLAVHTELTRGQRQQRVAELLVQVGLSSEHMFRYPHEFSGGQRQRIAIARAIAIDPAVLVCDESVSALDVSTQNQVIALIEDLQVRLGVACLFVAHDLAVVRHISDRVAVMYLGQIVETGPTERIFSVPAHPYTSALLAAAPVPDPVVQRARPRVLLRGDPPDPTEVPSGCRFRLRCPEVMPICAESEPEPRPVDGGGFAACHLVPPESGPVAVQASAAPGPTSA